MGGFTLFTPDESRSESGLYSLKFLKGQLAVALGGRVAEELVYGAEEVTTGASNDLQQVRNIAGAWWRSGASRRTRCRLPLGSLLNRQVCLRGRPPPRRRRSPPSTTRWR